MIDEAELGRMSQRAEAANGAVGAVLARRGDGLYAGLPYDEDPEALLEAAAESARHVPALIAEVRRLAPAAYLHGPEECMERDCDHFADDDGKPVNQDDEHCPHVQERVATLGHVKQAEYLERLVVSLRRRLAAGEDPSELVEAIDDALEVMRADEDIAVVAADELVGAETACSPQDSGSDHGGEVAR